MRSKWVLFAVVLFVFGLSYKFFGFGNDANTKLKSANEEELKYFGKLANQTVRKLATDESRSKESAGKPSDNVLDPLANAFVIENRKQNQRQTNAFQYLGKERREKLDLQIVGNNTWSFFPDMQVTTGAPHNPIFSLGPYRISRKEAGSPKNAMSLVYDENQQTLGILTGRLIIKVRDLYDIDPIAREYELKLDSVSTKIKTAYLNALHTDQFTYLNSALKSDGRIERFYFELVKTDWVKN